MTITEALTAALEPHGWRLRKRTTERLATAPGSSPAPASALLAPDIASVRRALAALPNHPEFARDYDEWIAVCHAVAAATGKSEEGRALWLDWSAQWGDDHAAAEARWQSVNPAQTSIGWEWLAEKASGESEEFRLSIAARDFSAAQVNGHAVAMDGGLFEKPQHDHPTEEEIAAAVELLQPGDYRAVDDILKLLARSRLSNVGRDQFLAEIKRRTKIGIGVLRDQLANDIRNLLRDSPDVGTRLAHIALKIFGKGLIAYWQRAWWQFNGGIWQPLEPTIIQAELQAAIKRDDRILTNQNGQQANTDAVIRQGISLLQGLTCEVLTPLDNPDFVLRDKINFRNGTLTLKPDGRHEFGPHDPRDCFLWRIDIDHNPLASCPLYDATLRDMLSRSYYTLRKEGDEEDWQLVKEVVDRSNASEENPVSLEDGRLAYRVGRSYRVVDIEDNARMVNEMLGYIMTPRRDARCFAVLKGNGVNGKSALIQSIASRMKTLTATLTMETLASRFATAELAGKLLLTIDEGIDGPAPAATIKTLCENRLIDADRKGQSFKKFMTTAFLIVNTNQHFMTYDYSEGIRSRILLIPFNKTYDPDNRSGNPWPRIMTSEEELSGMLNRWIDGLTDVLQRRYIKASRASEELKSKWEQTNTPEAAFIMAWCRTKPPKDATSEGDSLENLHQAYLNWYSLNVGRTQFARGRNKFAEVLEGMKFDRYESDGRTKIRGLWIDPDKFRASGYAGADFEPITGFSG